MFLLRKIDVVILLETPDTEVLACMCNLTEQMWIQTEQPKARSQFWLRTMRGKDDFFLNPENLKKVTSSGIQNPEATN